MMVGMLTTIDRALLICEWGREGDCLCCHVTQIHDPGCEMDQALAERGFPDQTSRDRARAALSTSNASTIPPPGDPNAPPA